MNKVSCSLFVFVFIMYIMCEFKVNLGKCRKLLNKLYVQEEQGKNGQYD